MSTSVRLRLLCCSVAVATPVLTSGAPPPVDARWTAMPPGAEGIVSERDEGPLVTLTPEDIESAISIGRDPTAARDLLARNRIVEFRPVFGIPTAPNLTPTFGVFSTPFSRVVIASCEARLAGRAFTPQDVTGEILRPELDVLAFRWNESAADQPIWCLTLSENVGRSGATSVPPVMNVDDVVVLPSMEKAAAPIPPLRSRAVTSRQLALPEHIWYGKGVQASFPLAGLPAIAVFRLAISPGGFAERAEYPGRDPRHPRFTVDLSKLR